MKLIATKRLKYDTRRMQAGDEFDATDMHARVLVGARKARYAPAQIVEPPPSMVEPEDAVVVEEKDEEADIRAEVDRLRGQAERLGIHVDGRWGIARLQQEIAMAKL